ncbi:hypothetical protein HDV05_006645 [Chytridiales sp. JEL 0842]|nr:hypothetical protein HDV05_006645 [Chytridiales sp. JEL 0842]
MLEQMKGLNAILLTSLDPYESYEQITQAAINEFAQKMKAFNDHGIPVIIRPAHEMNGPWYSYGQQPRAFIKFYRDVYAAVKAVAPHTGSFVRVGYPWTIGEYHIRPGHPDFPLCDTNGNGILDTGDDPYGPYWPGDDVVDWFGASTYFKGSYITFGTGYPYVRNDQVPDNQIYNQFTAVLGNGMSTYQFAASKNLPIAYPEYGGSFSPAYPGVSNLQTKQGMWRQTYSPQAKAQLPRVKLANWFDYFKYEDDSWRDFTVTNETTIGVLGPALKADFDSYPNILYSAQMAFSSSDPNCGCFGYRADGSAQTAATPSGGAVSNATTTSAVESAVVTPASTSGVAATTTAAAGAKSAGEKASVGYSSVSTAMSLLGGMCMAMFF